MSWMGFETREGGRFKEFRPNSLAKWLAVPMDGRLVANIGNWVVWVREPQLSKAGETWTSVRMIYRGVARRNVLHFSLNVKDMIPKHSDAAWIEKNMPGMMEWAISCLSGHIAVPPYDKMVDVTPLKVNAPKKPQPVNLTAEWAAKIYNEIEAARAEGEPLTGRRQARGQKRYLPDIMAECIPGVSESDAFEFLNGLERKGIVKYYVVNKRTRVKGIYLTLPLNSFVQEVKENG